MRNIGLLLIFLAFTVSVANADLIRHKVKQGETLQKISQQYFGTTRQWIKIWEQNKAQMEWPNSLEPGMSLSFEGPESTPTRAAAAKPAPIVAKDVPPPPATVNAKAVQVMQITSQFVVPPPPATEKKVAAPPAIHMVEIQPFNISREEPKRAIASVGATAPASNAPRIFGIRVDTRRALRAMGEDAAALAVDHELPVGIQKVNIGRPAFANESGVFSSVRVSEEEVHHAAEAQRISQVEQGIQAEQEALIEPLARTYEQIVSETTRKAVDSANKIQKTTPRVERPKVERKVASVTEKKEVETKRKPAGETFSSIEPDLAPAKPKVSNEIIQKLGSQKLFGPDL